MAKRPTLTDITSLTNSSTINALSQNWDAIEEAFDNTLSLDGSTPNSMNADLDLNGNSLLNVSAIDVENLTLDGQTVTDLASVPEWRGAWVTATAYAKNDLVKTSGNVYICLVAHTSGTFATDLTAVKWELMVSKGDSGAGTGDVLAANNLSDLASAVTARANLGLGTVATESTLPVAKGGTGATDASTARSNLGLGALAVEGSITTSQIAAATLVTAADTIASNDNDTTIPTTAAIIDYVALENSSLTLAGLQTAPASSFSWTSIPSGVNEIFVYFLEISGTSTAYNLVQLMVGGTPVTSGYFNAPTGGPTSGFYLPSLTSSQTGTGFISLHRVDGNTWVANAGASSTTGWKTFSGTIDGVRLIPSAGTFDAGSVAMSYR